MGKNSNFKEVIDRLMKHSSIESVLICNSDGDVLENNFKEKKMADNVAAFVSSISNDLIKTCKDNLNDELLSFHLTTKIYELEILPDIDSGLFIVSKFSSKR